MKLWRRALSIFALGMWAFLSPVAAEETLQLTIAPESVAIDAFYHGSRILVTGKLPADCEAIVRIMGQRSNLHLKKKGRVGGILWMNLDTITIENVPSVFMIYTAKDLTELLGPHPESSGVRKLGLASLQEHTRIVPISADHDALFKEFIKLKDKEGFYRTSQGLVHYGSAGDTQKSFEVSIPLPARFPPATYQVEVYAVRQGEVVAQAAQPLEVTMVGFPALLSSFAFRRGALFGLFAVVVAVVAGLIIGVVFSGSKGGSH